MSWTRLEHHHILCCAHIPVLRTRAALAVFAEVKQYCRKLPAFSAQELDIGKAGREHDLY